MNKTFNCPVYIVSACVAGRDNYPIGVYTSLAAARELFQLLARHGYVGIALTKSDLHD